MAEEIGVKRDTLAKAVQSGRLVENKTENNKEAQTRSERSRKDANAAKSIGVACTVIG